MIELWFEKTENKWKEAENDPISTQKVIKYQIGKIVLNKFPSLNFFIFCIW